MPELDNKIATWRKKVTSALPGQEETIKELEEHLRELVEASMRGGMSLDPAFAAALVRLGDADAIADEFRRLTPGRARGWWPARLVQGGMILVPVAMVTLLGERLLDGKMNLLLFTHVVVVTTGYSAILIGGALGLSCLLASRFRPLSERARQESSRLIFALTAMSAVLVPVGFVLGAIWAKRNLGHYWLSDPREVGAVLIMIWSAAVVILLRRTPCQSGLVWFVAILGSIITLIAWPGAALLGSGPQVAWFVFAIVASQLARRRQLRVE